MDSIDLEQVIGYLLATGVGAVLTYFRKLRRDVTSAHVKIRKLQSHFSLNENCESKSKPVRVRGEDHGES